MEHSDQQHGTIDSLGMQANQSIPVPDASLEEANGDMPTPHSTSIHALLEGSGSFDAWKKIVVSYETLPF